MALSTTRRQVVLAIAGAAASPRAAAQDGDWPRRRPLQWLVGFAPGGALDAVTRAVTERVGRALGQSIVVENRTGASGAIAAAAAAQAAPDGYTLISLPGPILYARPVPQPAAGLEPIGMMALGPMVVAGPAGAPTPDLAALLAAARREPDRFSFGTAGVGTSHHIAGELLNERAGTRMVHVPYRGGGGPLVTDLLAGRLPLAVIGAGPLLPHIRAGTLRAYAVTSARRFSGLPDTPTLAEQGFAGIDLAQWFGVAAPPATPQALATRLSAELASALAAPELGELLLRQGMAPSPGTPSAFGDHVAREAALYRELVGRFGITLE